MLSVEGETSAGPIQGNGQGDLNGPSKRKRSTENAGTIHESKRGRHSPVAKDRDASQDSGDYVGINSLLYQLHHERMGRSGALPDTQNGFAGHMNPQ
ncbi:MAG: hypothetical protein SGCHY_002850 [Lobulomycetales sp.]